MSSEPIPRSVTYSAEYAEQAATVEPDVRRLDEMIRGLEWVLARTPLRGSVLVVLDPGRGGPKLEVRATVEAQGALVTGIRKAY